MSLQALQTVTRQGALNNPPLLSKPPTCDELVARHELASSDSSVCVEHQHHARPLAHEGRRAEGATELLLHLPPTQHHVLLLPDVADGAAATDTQAGLACSAVRLHDGEGQSGYMMVKGSQAT